MGIIEFYQVKNNPKVSSLLPFGLVLSISDSCLETNTPKKSIIGKNLKGKIHGRF